MPVMDHNVVIHRETSSSGGNSRPKNNNAGSQAHCWLVCFFMFFYGLGLPPVIEAVSGHQTKQFMTSSEFDLEFPERPMLEKVEIL